MKRLLTALALFGLAITAALFMWPTPPPSAAQDGHTCKGDAPGVQFVPNPECPWEDAGEFSAWVSLAHENGYHETDAFENGTTLCAWGCCLQIVCPDTAEDNPVYPPPIPTRISQMPYTLYHRIPCPSAFLPLGLAAAFQAEMFRRRTRRPKP